MVKRRYPLVHSGEWVTPIRKGYRMMCCDCGLVHTMEIRVVKGVVQLRAWRDNRATGQARRWRKPAGRG